VEFLLDEVSFTWLWVHETKLPNKDEVISALNQVLAFNIIKKISMVVARGGLCVNLRRAIHNPGNACDIYEDEISDYGSDTDSDDKFNKTDSEFQHYLSDNDDIYAVLSHFINAIN
jgi:hypothetical protein